jgi:predicted class III extradiol MEMO1 family dioxygenase
MEKDVDEDEHSIEMQLPYLAKIFERYHTTHDTRHTHTTHDTHTTHTRHNSTFKVVTFLLEFVAGTR